MCFAVRSVSLLFHFSCTLFLIEASIPSYECVCVECHFVSFSEIDFVSLDCCVWSDEGLSELSDVRLVVHIERWIQVHLQLETDSLIWVHLVHASLHRLSHVLILRLVT